MEANSAGFKNYSDLKKLEKEFFEADSSPFFYL